MSPPRVGQRHASASFACRRRHLRRPALPCDALGLPEVTRAATALSNTDEGVYRRPLATEASRLVPADAHRPDRSDDRSNAADPDRADRVPPPVQPRRPRPDRRDRRRIRPHTDGARRSQHRVDVGGGGRRAGTSSSGGSSTSPGCRRTGTGWSRCSRSSCNHSCPRRCRRREIQAQPTELLRPRRLREHTPRIFMSVPVCRDEVEPAAGLTSAFPVRESRTGRRAGRTYCYTRRVSSR